MAVELHIKATGFLCKENLDLPGLLRRCKLNFGCYDPFFLLQEDHVTEVGLLYNPQRMGRGIYFDGQKMQEGEVKLCFNIPSTPSEIKDFMRVVSDVKMQYRNVELTYEKVTISFEEFIQGMDRYVEYSLNSLRGFCATKEYEAAILTLVAYPYTLTPDEMEHFGKDGTLEEFEELIHQKQVVGAHYIKPNVMKNDETGEIVAFYTLPENIACIVPVEHTCFLSLEQIVVDQGLIRFYIGSEDEMLGGYYVYNKFAQVMIEFGASYFDGDHLLLPELTKAELEEVVKAIEEMPDLVDPLQV